MAKKYVGFSRPLGKTLQEVARQHRTHRAQTEFPEPKQNSAFVAIAKTPAAGIAARSGLVLGKADCTFWYIDQNDTLTEFHPDEGLEVHNNYFFGIPGAIWIDVERENFSGKLLARLKGGFVGIIATEITARSSLTLGTGTVDLYEEDPDTGELTDLNSTQPVFNTSSSTGAVDKTIQVKISARGTLLWDVDDCTIL